MNQSIKHGGGKTNELLWRINMEIVEYSVTHSCFHVIELHHRPTVGWSHPFRTLHGGPLQSNSFVLPPLLLPKVMWKNSIIFLLWLLFFLPVYLLLVIHWHQAENHCNHLKFWASKYLNHLWKIHENRQYIKFRCTIKHKYFDKVWSSKFSI